MKIMNLLQKEGWQRGTWNDKKTDTDFYKKIVDAYEAKSQELVVENIALIHAAYLSLAGNEKCEADPSQSPLGGKTKCDCTVSN
ncbi:hypothetical protein Bca101_025191 [Brassica carinata]